jgi:hypothetical protein
VVEARVPAHGGIAPADGAARRAGAEGLPRGSCTSVMAGKGRDRTFMMMFVIKNVKILIMSDINV